MDVKQIHQERQYGFPYHHIPSVKRDDFSQSRLLSWGYVYMSYLESVLDYIDSLSPDSILDIGCGDGKFLYEARKRFPDAILAGNDYSQNAIAFAKAFNFNDRVHLSTNPAEKIALEMGPFDIVTSIEVLEHIPLEETTSFCKNFASALAPHGLGIITVPSDNLPVNRKHYQHFNEKSLKRTLSEHLEVIEIRFLNKISWINWFIQRILSNRFFILNHSGIINTLYKYYCKNMLLTTPDKCERLMAVVKRR
jgi:2-polyprenyl-3-methyl-5-hydroxy-6-metoxy-1,4-benzoquinol methylase